MATGTDTAVNSQRPANLGAPVEVDASDLSSTPQPAQQASTGKNLGAPVEVDPQDLTKGADPFEQVDGHLMRQPSLGQQFKWDVGTPLRTAIRNIENYTQEGRKEHPALAIVGDALKRVYVPGDEVPNDPTHPLAQPVPPPGPGFSSALEGGAADAAAANTTVAARPPVSATVTQKLIKGAKVEQAPAKAAIQDAAAAASKNPMTETSLPYIMEQPIAEGESEYKSLYSQFDRAAGTDIKKLRDDLEHTEYQIRQAIDPDAEAKFEAKRSAIMDKIEQAKHDAVAANVPLDTLDKADKVYGRVQAQRDVEKVFQTPANVFGNARRGADELINVEPTIKALQKLQYADKYGSSRLEQALGEQNANALLGRLYEAQRLGQSAIRARVIAEWIAGGVIGAGTLVDAAKHLMPGK
jgi:hypothetical protein